MNDHRLDKFLVVIPGVAVDVAVVDRVNVSRSVVRNCVVVAVGVHSATRSPMGVGRVKDAIVVNRRAVVDRCGVASPVIPALGNTAVEMTVPRFRGVGEASGEHKGDGKQSGKNASLHESSPGQAVLCDLNIRLTGLPYELRSANENGDDAGAGQEICGFSKRLKVRSAREERGELDLQLAPSKT